MNLYMSSAEYQALMKEMGYAATMGAGKTATTTSTGGNGSSSPSAAAESLLMGQLTLRLDDKWERFTANLAVQVLELGREIVTCFRIATYATSMCLVLYGTSCLIRALRDRNERTSSSSSNNDQK